ncbi:Nn.00g084640.m01.CDS01 [Neocucurbitaria sp. VM-36]
MSSTLLLFLALLTAFLSYIAIYRIYFHPLSKVPGPPLARITKLWLVWHVRKRESHLFFPSLHKRYGPLVRIAPDQVLACSEEAVRLGYAAGTNFTKGDFYQVTATPDKKWRQEEYLDLFTEMNMEKYRRQRRAIGPAYSIAGLEKHEALLDGYIEQYIARLKSLEGRKVDLAEWAHIYALDALSHVVVSKAADYTSQGSEGGNKAASVTIWSCFMTIGLFPGFVNLMHSIPKVGPLLMVPACLVFGLPPPAMWPLFGFCVPSIIERLKTLDSTSNIQLPGDRPGFIVSHGKDLMARAKDSEDSEAPATNGSEKDLLATLMKLHHDKEARFPPSWVLGIALTTFAAGHETMMFMLAGCIYHTFTSPSILQRLRTDMAHENVTKTSGYTEIVTKLPLFLAVMKESMRLWPSVGFILPRNVPASTGATVSNTFLPPGTTMAISLWATHYDADLFPRPEMFDPDRWLADGTEAKKKEIGRLEGLWMGFGGGSRSCVGQHLARFFVVKILARLVLEFDVEISGTPEFGGWFPEGMEGVDARFLERRG